MRRQGIVWLGATIAILGAAACFSDPTSANRGSASRLQITEISGTAPLQAVGTLTFINVDTGQTITLSIQLRDKQGNYFSFPAPTVGTASAAVATLTVYPDSSNPLQPYNGDNPFTAPGNPYWKVLLHGVATGTTTGTVTAAGVTDTFAINVP